MNPRRNRSRKLCTSSLRWYFSHNSFALSLFKKPACLFQILHCTGVFGQQRTFIHKIKHVSPSCVILKNSSLFASSDNETQLHFFTVLKILQKANKLSVQCFIISCYLIDSNNDISDVYQSGETFDFCLRSFFKNSVTFAPISPFWKLPFGRFNTNIKFGCCNKVDFVVPPLFL